MKKFFASQVWNFRYVSTPSSRRVCKPPYMNVSYTALPFPSILPDYFHTLYVADIRDSENVPKTQEELST